MFKFVKKHQRKFLAIFVVGLMVIFVASPGTMGPGRMADPVVASIGEEKIHAEEQMNSRRLWSRLQHTFLKNMSNDRQNPFVPATAILSPEAVGFISREPDTFLLLQKEAEKMGLSPSRDRVEELMNNQVSLDNKSAPEDVMATRQAFAAIVLVRAGYERAASVLKTSAPEKQYQAAMMGQKIKLNYIAIDTSEFKSAVTAPTPEQLKQQFDKYADVLADHPTDENPFGFGYKYPPRTRVEYLTIRHADLREAVRQTKDAAAWEIEARKQYRRNLSLYPTTKPTKEQDSLAPKLGVATQPTSQPTTRPLSFADYRQQIEDELMDEAEAKLLGDIRKKITTTMQADWAAYRASVNPTTAPSTQPVAGPTSTLGVPYGSAEYLPTLALAIQKEFKVLPPVNRFAKDWLTEKDLGGLPGIEAAFIESGDPNAQPISFAQYVTNFLDAFGHKPSSRDAAPTLSVLSPSPALTDFSRNVHYFRVFAADPSHAATDMAPFAQQLEADYRADAALKLAREQADKFLAIAKSSGLDAASVSSGRKLSTTSEITATQGVAPMPALPLKPESAMTLARAAFDLLKNTDAIKSGKAVALVSLPRDNKVLLVSPAEITPLFPPDLAYMAETYFSRQTAEILEQNFRMKWFSTDEVQKRLNYKSEEKKEKPTAG